ncbi:hypothetical protein ACWGJ2_40150 [Streptomyces sp. NPDC054796]
MTPRNDGEQHSRAGVEYARDALEMALHAAGLPLSLYVPVPTGTNPPRLAFGTTDADTALALTTLIHKGLKEHHRARRKLGAALERHGLRAPGLAVCQGTVVIGEIPVEDAAALAHLLGEPTGGLDFYEPREGPRITGLLYRALTDLLGHAVDVAYHSFCRRCHSFPAVEVGALDPGAARRLAAALRKTAPVDLGLHADLGTGAGEAA